MFIRPITFVFSQDTPASTWNVVHNLGRHPSVTVVDSTGHEVTGDVHYLSSNAVQVTFSAGFSGTTQGTGLVLTKNINQFATVASGTGCVLPNVGAGGEIIIINRGANTLNIFPPSGGAINALASNAAITLATVTTLRFIQTTATQYYTG